MDWKICRRFSPGRKHIPHERKWSHRQKMCIRDSLYPSANILVTTKKDFETHNRKKFCARIATGDYDAIIMGHSQFERIPISRERQERLLYEQIDEITEGIAEVQASGGERFTVKPVSYTHLDVYKRQMSRSPHRICRNTATPMMGCSLLPENGRWNWMPPV